MPSFAITEVVAEAATTDPMGQLWSRNMTLMDYLKQALLKDLNRWQENYLPADQVAMPNGWRRILILAHNIFPESDIDKTFFCLSITTIAGWPSPFILKLPGAPEIPPDDDRVREVTSLALNKVNNQSNIYTHIGLVRYMRENWFKDVVPSKITIV